ncbi:hypothetical protein QJT78_42990, partial [Bradyrhizobium sp. Mp27]|nr:hypothetical protein [Bradyrhizobium sp. Mp27]
LRLMLVAVRKQTTFIINLKRSTLLTRGSATGRIPHLTQSGEAETGLTQLRQGLPGWRATGAGLYEPYFLGLQAEANACLGAVEQGLEIVANALDRVEETGEGWFEAELHRIMGELMLQLPKPDPIAAEAQFRHAAATARQQGAKLWELRAATHLARVWRGQGRRGEAHDLLAPLYSQFTEGFATPDLQAASAILRETAASSEPKNPIPNTGSSR